MRENFGRDKKRIEEMKRKRRDEKMKKRLQKPDGSAPEAPPAPENPFSQGPQ